MFKDIAVCNRYRRKISYTYYIFLLSLILVIQYIFIDLTISNGSRSLVHCADSPVSSEDQSDGSNEEDVDAADIEDEDDEQPDSQTKRLKSFHPYFLDSQGHERQSVRIIHELPEKLEEDSSESSDQSEAHRASGLSDESDIMVIHLVTSPKASGIDASKSSSFKESKSPQKPSSRVLPPSPVIPGAARPWKTVKGSFIEKYRQIMDLITEYPTFNNNPVNYREFAREFTTKVCSGTPALPNPSSFTLGARIGKGSFGKVYHGTYSRDKHVVAIKQTKKFEHYGTLLNELRTVSHLFTRDQEHASKYIVPICTVLFPDSNAELESKKGDVTFSNKVIHGVSLPLLVYDMYDTDLERYAKQVMIGYPNPKKETVLRAIMKKLLHASIFLHKHGVIHDDLKCDNILINYKSGVLEVFITDFGIASIGRSSYREAHKRSKISSGLVHGIPGHNPAKDIFDLGQTMLEVIRWSGMVQKKSIISIAVKMMKATKEKSPVTAEQVLRMNWFQKPSSIVTQDIKGKIPLMLHRLMVKLNVRPGTFTEILLRRKFAVIISLVSSIILLLLFRSRWTIIKLFVEFILGDSTETKRESRHEEV
jgi:serine/threonine protein kinase